MDSNFTSSDEGGTIYFNAEGGSVTVNVDCEIEWAVENHASDLFGTEIDLSSGTLTVTAEQSTTEEGLTGTITLATASSWIEFATITVNQAAYIAPAITLGAEEWNAPAIGRLETMISVTSPYEWSAECSAEWLKIEKTDAGLSLSVEENQEYESRETEITLTSTDDIETASATISVTQDGLAYINVAEEELALYEDEQSVTVAVESNFEWEWSAGEADWIGVAADESGNAVVSVTANKSDDREAVITFTVGDGEENVATAELAVSQTGGNALILVYNTSSTTQTVVLPFEGTVNCTVDWGDGTVEEVTDIRPSHDYDSVKEYTVRVNGTVTTLRSAYVEQANSVLLTKVKQWGKTGLTSMLNAFKNCTSLTSLPDETGDVFAEVTTFNGTFYNCIGLTAIPKDIFKGCSNVTTFSQVFAWCTKLSELPSGLFDDCTAVTTFAQAFYECTSLKEIPSGLFDHCTSVTSFQKVFQYCYALTKAPDGLFDYCTAVTDMSYVFHNCTSLSYVPDDIFAKNTEVTTFGYAFVGDTALTSVSTDIFSNNLKVKTCNFTFSGCTGLTGESPYNTLSDGTKVHLYERSSYPDIFTAPTSTGSCFKNCTNLTDYDDIPSGWK